MPVLIMESFTTCDKYLMFIVVVSDVCMCVCVYLCVCVCACVLHHWWNWCHFSGNQSMCLKNHLHWVTAKTVDGFHWMLTNCGNEDEVKNWR